MFHKLTCHLILTIVVTVGFANPAAEKPAIVVSGDNEANEAQRKKNLRQIGLAFKKCHAERHLFPAADSNGHPKGKFRREGLSWRVYVLPYLGEQKLYDQFKHSERWDSPHNKKLISKMPKIFAKLGTARELKEGKTAIQVFVGKQTPFGKTENGQSVGAGLPDIIDGTYNTLLAVETGDDKAEFWTKPGGLPFNPMKDPLRSLGKISDRGFLALFFSGEVFRIERGVRPKTLRHLIQHNDSQPIGEIPGVHRLKGPMKSP